VYPWFQQIFTKADGIQAISNYLADWAREMGAKCSVSVIPNGVDVERFASSGIKGAKHEVILITTSRLVKKNAVSDIIKALKYLSDNVKLQILGTGPLERELKQFVKKENLEHRVRFAGFVSQENLPAHLHKADIFIRPSLSEGQGISFIEAMAAGLPVIATPVGGIPDFLIDGETGLFCKVNDPKSIAEKVREFAGNPELRTKIIKNAFLMVKEKYDWTIVAAEMKKIFQNL
jgi:glycosyltransferase involved in cell wall biosynthesis